MPRSSFTAYVEMHVFFMLMGDSEISHGVQTAVRCLLETNPPSTDVMAVANEMVRQARQELGEDASQADLLRVIKDEFWRYKEASKAPQV